MQIEVVCIGTDLYGPLESAIRTLNGIQDEFVFRTAPESMRADPREFVRNEYRKDELFGELDRYRQRRAANDLFILGFVDRPIEGNIFGSHDKSVRAAVATVWEHKRYASDIKRFCSYYLLRYVLSFCNFSVKSHEKEADKNCYFHRKTKKKEIGLSMNAGRLCDDCRRELQLSASQSKAFRIIATYIQGAYPHALVMKGGGIKGLAYAGALEELEKHFTFDLHVGTSAGAIAAVLLASGATAAELKAKLSDTKFSAFLDWCWRWPINLLRGGLHRGDAIQDWVVKQLRSKITKQGNIELANLPRRAILYACSSGRGTVVFDSQGKRKETEIGFAVRSSMSIPFFFVPQEFEGYSIYDGGLRHNFPVSRFVDDHPNKLFIALYLQSSAEPKKRFFRAVEVFDVWMEGDERELVDTYAEGVAVIDPSPVKTTDFALSRIEKELLLNAGRLAALQLIRRRDMENAPSDKEIQDLSETVRKLRTSAVRLRLVRRVFKIIVFALLLGLLLHGYSADWHYNMWNAFRRIVNW